MQSILHYINKLSPRKPSIDNSLRGVSISTATHQNRHYFVYTECLNGKKTQLPSYRNDPNSTANWKRIIKAHLIIRCVTRYQMCC